MNGSRKELNRGLTILSDLKLSRGGIGIETAGPSLFIFISLIL